MTLVRELLALWLLKLYNVRIRTQFGIYAQIYLFTFRISNGLRPWELLQNKEYIWPYIPPLVLIRIQYFIFSSFYNIKVVLCIQRIPFYLIREGVKKKPIESVIMIIPRRTPPPSFLKTVIALRFFFLPDVFWLIGWFRYVLKHILGMFETNFG